MASTTEHDEEATLLHDALAAVSQQSQQMRKCLDTKGKLMDALKHASTMLSELRTSALSPKQYYELYMAEFDALGYLAQFLRDNHPNNHLADLYELVQYAGNIVPRLYLMVTVGTVYMSVKEAPVKEILKDMIEMCRGVQNPIRGLFLRYYLSQSARDYLPTGTSDGPQGNLEDSINFILANFMEMNKLWVRLQHQGHSRERQKRTKERQELQILVGSNLVRLSQLEGIDKDLYKTTILPAIFEQVIQCKDVLAQEYLLEVITQVFPDEFHLHTLDQFLSATLKLNPGVKVTRIIIALMDRLSAYYSLRKGELYDSSAIKDLAAAARELTINNKNEQEESPAQQDETGDDLFCIFWNQITALIANKVDLPISDITALLLSLSKLNLNCYPERLDYIDKVLVYGNEKSVECKDSIDFHSQKNMENCLQLFLAPVDSCSSIVQVLSIPSYVPLLNEQPIQIKRAVASAVANNLLKSSNAQDAKKDNSGLDTVKHVEGIMGLLAILIEPVATATTAAAGDGPRKESPEALEEQGWLARIVHLVHNEDCDIQLELLQTVGKAYAKGGDRVRFTTPSIVNDAFRLVRRYRSLQASDSEQEDDSAKKGKLTTTFKFIFSILENLYQNVIGCGDLSLRLFVDAGRLADQVNLSEMSYELYAQAFTVYEEGISDSKSQFQGVCIIAGALHASRNFSKENYDTLITKCVLYGSKLLKKPDQCRTVYLLSHLWWGTEISCLGEDEDDDGKLYRDGNRVLECLQRSLRVADSCMDAAVSVELFVEVLNRYLYYFDRGCDAVTVKYVNGLISLINSNLSNSLSQGTISSDSPGKHFKRTLEFIEGQQEQDARFQAIRTTTTTTS